MKLQRMRSASVLVMTVFVIAMISAVVIGMLEITMEEMQLAQNYIYAACTMGVSDYVTKPFDFTQLMDRIQAALLKSAKP